MVGVAYKDSVGGQTGTPTGGFVIEGFGANTIGGTGGTVINVTNLNDSGAGSLRAALLTSGPRIVRFTVSGTITLASEIEIGNPYLTIDGSTAPNGGICIRNTSVTNPGCLTVRCPEVIIRHIRVRPGDYATQNRAISIINPDGPGETYNVCIDHCSLSWSTDDHMDCWGTTNVRNVTVQWCICSEGLTSGGIGRAWLINCVSCTYHHNLAVHVPERGGSENESSDTQFINNICYNGYFTQIDPWFGVVRGNYIGNYYKEGPQTWVGVNAELVYYNRDFSSVSGMYTSDNKREAMSGAVTDARIDASGSGITIADSPFDFPAVTTQNATANYTALLASDVGASLPKRDSVDVRAITQCTNRTGNLIASQDDVGGYPDLTV